MRQNKIISIVIGLLIVGVAIFAATRLKPATKTANTNTDTIPKRCVGELKICPDGNGVTRILPDCEFTACQKADAAELTKDWKPYANSKLAFSLRHPPTWNVTARQETVSVAATGVAPLTIDSVNDDSLFFESTNDLALTIDGQPATQVDYLSGAETTRTIWIPRNGTFLRFSWYPTGNDQPYHHIISTIDLTP